VIGVANAAILPFDWSATVGEFAETVAKYQKEAGGAFDLSPAAKAVKDLNKALRKFQAGIKARKIRPAKANPVIMGLARILVPINFTREARFRHDPAVPIPPLPALSAAAEIAAMPEEKQGFARTQLARGQNRVVAALRQATRMVEGAL
jgi:N-acetylated-alpha-linked acidic dipeptidase